MPAARPLAPFILPALLTMMGGGLLIASLIQGHAPMALFGSALAFFSGLVAFGLQLGMISRKLGLFVGVLVVVLSAALAWYEYRKDIPDPPVTTPARP